MIYELQMGFYYSTYKLNMINVLVNARPSAGFGRSNAPSAGASESVTGRSRITAYLHRPLRMLRRRECIAACISWLRNLAKVEVIDASRRSCLPACAGRAHSATTWARIANEHLPSFRNVWYKDRRIFCGSWESPWAQSHRRGEFHQLIRSEREGTRWEVSASHIDFLSFSVVSSDIVWLLRLGLPLLWHPAQRQQWFCDRYSPQSAFCFGFPGKYHVERKWICAYAPAQWMFTIAWADLNTECLSK